MFRQLLPLFLTLLSLTAFGQFASPISWEFSHEQIEGDRFMLKATATAEDGWSIYSQFTEEGGPVPTAFYWTEGDHYELVGKTQEEGHLKEGMDDLFGVNVSKFLSDEPVVFSQEVKVVDYGQGIEMAVEYMCCDNEQCLPPTDEPHTYVIAPPAPARGEAIKSPPSGAGGLPAPASAPKSTTKIQSEVIAEKQEVEQPREVDQPQEEVLATINGPAAVAPTEEQPVTWSFRAEELAGERYRVILEGDILKGWTTYSQQVDPMIGPVPTELVIEEGEAQGSPTETADHLKSKFDPIWDATVQKIVGGKVTYSQVVKADGNRISGFLEYQACDDESCLPPTPVPFALDLAGNQAVATLDGIGADDTPTFTTDNEQTATATNLTSVAFNTDPAGSCSIGEAKTEDQDLLSIFGLGLLGGLFALIMPCIFPMIPLTVSFFTKSGGTRAAGIRRAGLYGFFIFLIYVLLSLPFHVVDGLDPGLLNNIASSVPLNIAFFLVFIYFAGSFFGFYEIALPDSWSNRASQAEGTGGVTGIFFMALTLALVSFSCTGPILGSLLVEAVSGGAWPLTFGMAGFGVALGLPFALFAAFPGLLKSMPSSGGWLNSVKVVLGFAEIALAFKFLSNADLVGEWNFLRLEPFLLIWMFCALGIAAYLFGLISFPLDSKNRKPGLIGTAVAIAGVVFTGYLALGLTASDITGTYAPRTALSGIAPPVCYNYFLPCDEERNITPFKSLEEGLAYAREVNKPVMLDFTGYTCVNCRKMEENVWSEDNIRNLLSDEYVLISLYVDDREPLPETEHQEVTRLDGSGRKKLIDQVGEKWHYLQQSVFERASQPYYVLVSPDGQTLNPPVAYTPDIQDYEDFLQCGLSTFRDLQGK